LNNLSDCNLNLTFLIMKKTDNVFVDKKNQLKLQINENFIRLEKIVKDKERKIS